MPAPNTATQQALALPFRGGARRGAGRKPAGDRARVPHAARDEVRPYHPVHVTLRVAEHVWNLRSERSYRIIDAALRAARRRPEFRVVHFSIQGNHVHLIVEANGTRRGEPRSTKGWVDPFSSAAMKTPREAQGSLFVEPATCEAGTWLLRRGPERR